MATLILLCCKDQQSRAKSVALRPQKLRTELVHSFAARVSRSAASPAAQWSRYAPASVISDRPSLIGICVESQLRLYWPDERHPYFKSSDPQFRGQVFGRRPIQLEIF